MINSKILSLFSTYLVLITVQITVLIYLAGRGTIPRWFYGFYGVLIMATVAAFIDLSWPKKYLRIEIFGDGRFSTLCGYDSRQLLQDFIVNTRKAYLYNEEKSRTMGFGLIIAQILVGVTFLFFFIGFIVFLA